MEESIVLKPIYLERNHGLGNALKIALDNCQYELVARMDSDDISLEDRFETQLRYFKEHPEIDLVGGNITEFIGDEYNIIGQRYVPETDAEIKKYMKKRCAMNHMSVMYKKSVVIKSGSYQDWYHNEDYFLWIRMLLMGAKFANVPENIVNVRVGNEMSARRGGIKYFKSEAALQWYMLKKRIITIPQYVYNILIRFLGEVVMTNWLRAKLFRFTRKKYNVSSMAKKSQQKKVNKTKNKEFKHPPFSVAISVYAKDNPEWFDQAMRSLINQTIKPNEIVLVVDGPISEGLQKIIDKYIIITKNLGMNS